MMEGIYGGATEEAIEEVLQDPTEILEALADDDPDPSTLHKVLSQLKRAASTVDQAGTSGEPSSKKSKPDTDTPVLPPDLDAPPVPAPVGVSLAGADPIIPVDKGSVHHFGIPNNLMPHRMSGLYSGKYQCVECGATESNKSECCAHVRQHHQGSKLQCPYCAYSSWGARQWLGHMDKQHRGEDRYPRDPPMMSAEQREMIQEVVEKTAEKPKATAPDTKGRGKKSSK